ncbi:MAG: hypothetical protein V4495_11805 [Pseudomonadota bacterium]
MLRTSNVRLAKLIPEPPEQIQPKEWVTEPIVEKSPKDPPDESVNVEERFEAFLEGFVSIGKN